MEWISFFVRLFILIVMGSGVHTLKRIQVMKIGLDEAWDFFSSPQNLQKITPGYMKFKVIGNTFSETMYEGQIIEYTVRPLLGIPLYWMTEITHVREKKYFIDEQRFGPYALWHHQHHFKEVANGVEMTDFLHYKVPLYGLGKLMNKLLVEKQINRIFDYRYEKVAEMFG